jgi:hypothetical protein
LAAPAAALGVVVPVLPELAEVLVEVLVGLADEPDDDDEAVESGVEADPAALEVEAELGSGVKSTVVPFG